MEISRRNLSSLQAYPDVASVVGRLRAARSGTAISNWYRCGQSKKLLMDGRDTLGVVLSPLCQPSARFVVRGPVLSNWLHSEYGKVPFIHVMSTYEAKAVHHLRDN